MRHSVVKVSSSSIEMEPSFTSNIGGLLGRCEAVDKVLTPIKDAGQIRGQMKLDTVRSNILVDEQLLNKISCIVQLVQPET